MLENRISQGFSLSSNTVTFEAIFPGIVSVRYVSAFRRLGPVILHKKKKKKERVLFHGISAMVCFRGIVDLDPTLIR